MHNVNLKTILSSQNGMNIYRGCTHGCIYCDARSTCYQMNHMFEDVEVKINAPELLEHSLLHKRKKCMIGTGSMSDPYQQCEKDLCLTRRCLELIDKYNFGLAIQTKSDMILRDLDLLKSINKKTKCVVEMTLTTFDDKLCKILEPNVCVTSRRVEVLNIMRDEGIPTVVWLTPFLPYINGTLENAIGLMDYCLKAQVHGIFLFGAGLTLRDGDRQYYYKKLDEHFPRLKQKYMNTFGEAYELPCTESREIISYVKDVCTKNKMIMDNDVFAYMHKFCDKTEPLQMELF